MEQRAYMRQPVDFPALVSGNGFSGMSCQVQDFCLGGMFLKLNTSQPKASIYLKEGGSLDVQVDVQDTLGPQSVYLNARVVRIVKNGIGISFLNPDASQLVTLQNHARSFSSKPEAGKAVSKNRFPIAKKLEIGSAIVRTVNQFLSVNTQSYDKKAVEALLEQSNKARSDEDRVAWLDAIQVINRSGTELKRQFIRHVIEPLKAVEQGMPLQSPEKEQKGNGLSLVDKDEFEGWLSLRVMSSRAEGQFNEELLPVKLRFDELLNESSSMSRTPLHPSLFCNAFGQALNLLPVKTRVHRVLLSVFENTLVSMLGKLYSEVNSQMAAKGVLPDLDVVKHLQKTQGKTKQDKRRDPRSSGNTRHEGGEYKNNQQAVPERQSSFSGATSGQAAGPAPSQDSPEAGPVGSQSVSVGNVVGASANNAGGQSALGLDSNGQSAPPEPDVADSTGEQVASDSAPADATAASANKMSLHARQFEFQQRIARNAYESVQKILNKDTLEHYQAQYKQRSVNPDLPVAEPAQVKHALQDLQHSGAEFLQMSPVPTLHERVDQAVSSKEGGERQLDNDLLAAIEVIEQLFKGIVGNMGLSERVRDAFRQLEIPFLRLMQNDDGFLSEETHPARQLLNRMAHLGVRGTVNLGRHEDAICQEVDTINDGFSNNINIFEESLHKLDKLSSRQDAVYKRNLRRVAESSAGHQQVRTAKKEAADILEKMIGGKSVPKAVLSLVDEGWHELLVQILLRDGGNSARWHNSLTVIEQLIQAQNGLPETEQRDQLLAAIKTGLRQVDETRSMSQLLVRELRALLSEKTRSSASPPMVDVPAGSISPDPAAAFASEERKKWMKRVCRYQVGDWFLQKASQDVSKARSDKSGESQTSTMRLAWISDDQTHFVFVNHQGLKVSEYTLDELVNALASGAIQPGESMDMPAVDRGLDHLVQQVYTQMAHRAKHDELTGLANRKEFEKQLGLKLVADKTATLLLFDIDQFKVVNTLSGPEGGDSLLVQISRVLNDFFPGALLSRLGGDEFAVYLQGLSEPAGLRAAEKLCKSIADQRFECEGKIHAVTISCGVVFYQGESVSVAELLRQSDNACLAAKEAGKNRVQVFQQDDADMAQRTDVMSWAAELTDALDNDRLSLRCQKIEPTRKTIDSLPSYEVLISVLDENGEMQPPQGFMTAAERYNRMHSIDRWVIRNVLKWMHANTAVLDKLDHISINLSGQSLNDTTLLDYIFDQFTTYPVPQEKICFEVTETAAIASLDNAIDFILDLQAVGCRFSLDDFGSGLASYGYLKKLPVNYIKIDGTFIKDVAREPTDFALVRSINEMGHLMGKQTIAEFVEDDDILNALTEIGVDYVQGFGIERPRPISELKLA